MHTVFISHAAEDRALAEQIVHYLEGGGIACWLATRDVDVSDDFATQVVRAIDQADQFLVIVSDAANESPHVRQELERAVGSRKRIVPLRTAVTVTSDALSYFLSGSQWIDVDPSAPADVLERVRAVLTRGPTQLGSRSPPPLQDVLSGWGITARSVQRHPAATLALICSLTVVLSPIGFVLGLLYLLTPGHSPEGRVVAGWAVLSALGVLIVAAGIAAAIGAAS